MSEGAPERPTVLITGVSGLIGTRLASLLAGAYRVVGLDVQEPPEHFAAAGGLFFACDLTSDASTEEALARVRASVGPRLASVVHLAAYYDFSGAPSPLYEELTVEGTRRLLRALRTSMQPEQLVFCSTLLVMRPADGGTPLTEESPVQGEWEYPASKLEAEAVIEEERGDVPAVVLRLAGAYDEEGHSPPLTQQIWRIRERKLVSFLFPGDRSHGQSFVHLDDAVRCIRAAIEKRGELRPSETFLVGEPETLSYGELQDEIGELLHGHAWPTLRVPAPVAKAGAWVREKIPGGDDGPFIKPWMIDLADAHYPVSIERARKRLGWEPRHRLRQTLPAMIEHLQADPASFYRENDLPADDGARPEGGAGG